MQSQKRQNNLCSFPRQTIQYNSNPSLCPNHSAEKAETEWFYEDLQDLLELTPKKDVLFIIKDWKAKVESQETPGLTGKFGLGVQNEAGQSIIEFCQVNTVFITTHLLPKTQEKTLHMDITRCQYQIRLILFFAAKDGYTLYSQQKQDWELTLGQITNSLFPNSDLISRK